MNFYDPVMISSAPDKLIAPAWGTRIGISLRDAAAGLSQAGIGAQIHPSSRS